MSYLWLGGEGAHGYVAEMIRVTYRDVDEEVGGTGHVVEGDYLAELGSVGSESCDL